MQLHTSPHTFASQENAIPLSDDEAGGVGFEPAALDDKGSTPVASQEPTRSKVGRLLRMFGKSVAHIAARSFEAALRRKVDRQMNGSGKSWD
jgi:hypothetical protein